jgi:hypothetical protein
LLAPVVLFGLWSFLAISLCAITFRSIPAISFTFIAVLSVALSVVVTILVVVGGLGFVGDLFQFVEVGVGIHTWGVVEEVVCFLYLRFD